MTPIVRYLKEGWLLEDRAEARKIQIRTTCFVIIDDVLYRGCSLTYLRCTNSKEADYVLCEIHEGVYGNHIEARSLAGKALRVGYYWPTACSLSSEGDRSNIILRVPRSNHKEQGKFKDNIIK